jgi:hypothetical protein
MRANRTPRCVSVPTGRGYTEVHLQEGQFIFGRKSAAKSLRGLNPKQVYGRIKKLEKLEILGTQPGTHYTIVTVCNWGTYQDSSKSTGHPTGHPTGTQRTPNGHPTDTDKKEKNEEKVENEEKEEKASCRNLRFDEADSETAGWMFGKIQQINPGQKEPSFRAWANELRLIRERDGRTDAQIRELFTWANQDDFWRANILSPAKLRKQWDQLTIKRKEPPRGKPNLSIGPGQRHPDDRRSEDGTF